MQGFFRAICQVGIFMICSQALLHFRPNKGYEKYMRLLVSAMILVQILIPIGHFFQADFSLNMEERIAWFEERLQEGRNLADQTGIAADQIISDMTMEQIRSLLSERAEEETQESQAPSEDEINQSGQDHQSQPVPAVEPIQIEIE